MQAHIKNNHLSNRFQSAYRKHHSTESALLKVHIDHATLPNRLSDWYGISTSGQGQIWFSSYLQNRRQSVKIKDSLSDKVTLSYGVPQGYVLGPVRFILYTTPLSTIIYSDKNS